MAIKIKGLEKITGALGYVCIFWAWLEGIVDELLEMLTPLQDGDVSRAITSCADIRDKIRMLRAIAFVRKFDDDWFKKLNTTLNEIDNELRPLRNRFIHDAWSRPRGKLIRRTRQVKFKRPQAFASELSTEEKTPVKMGEVWNLAVRIVRAQIALTRLLMEYQAVKKVIDDEVERRAAKQLAEQIFAALFPSSPSKSPRQTPRPKRRDSRPKSARSKRQRLPRSSRA